MSKLAFRGFGQKKKDDTSAIVRARRIWNLIPTAVDVDR